MRVAILDFDYLRFLGDLYSRTPGLEEASYDEQLRARRETLFGTAASYAAAFRELGHEAQELYLNAGPLQEAWAREHRLRVRTRSALRTPRGLARRLAGGWHGLPAAVAGGDDRARMAEILRAQLEELQPDLVLNHDLGGVGAGVLRAAGALVVGQHAASPLPVFDVSPYDLFVSSFPPTVDELRRRGARAERLRLAFDPAVLDALGPRGSGLRYGLTFVGSLDAIHSSRRAFLEKLRALVPELRVWAGAAWGREMYEILRASRATVNHHGDISPFANNLRLYEATGVRTVLLTDAKPDLADLFAPGSEVLTYRTPEECAAAYASLDDATRDRVASAGQARTLGNHTFVARVRELLSLLF